MSIDFPDARTEAWEDAYRAAGAYFPLVEEDDDWPDPECVKTAEIMRPVADAAVTGFMEDLCQQLKRHPNITIAELLEAWESSDEPVDPPDAVTVCELVEYWQTGKIDTSRDPMHHDLCLEAVKRYQEIQRLTEDPSPEARAELLQHQGAATALRAALCHLHGWEPTRESGEDSAANDAIMSWWRRHRDWLARYQARG